ncbi:hypothetical protein SNE40_023464 [Patella caerulea]|uniref:Uncharacterized protein n=1 Tax=Patella caerulea TaxID=87958 RepID=A0AAN8G346_PATCE
MKVFILTVLVLLCAVAVYGASTYREDGKRHLILGSDPLCSQQGDRCSMTHHCCGDLDCHYDRFFTTRGRCVEIREAPNVVFDEESMFSK